MMDVWCVARTEDGGNPVRCPWGGACEVVRLCSSRALATPLWLETRMGMVAVLLVAHGLYRR